MRIVSRGVTRVLALTALAAAVVGVPRTSSAGNVNVEVDLTGGTTILYYYSSLKVQINSTDLVTPPTAGCSAATNGTECVDSAVQTAVVPTANVTSGGVKATFSALSAPAGTGPTLSAMPLFLENVWALRAIGGSSANTTVTAALGTGTTLTATGGGTIVINGVALNSGAAPATVTFGATTAAATIADPGLVTPVNGYVALRLNMTNATSSGATGDYKNTANAQYTISVTGT